LPARGRIAAAAQAACRRSPPARRPCAGQPLRPVRPG
jgi:hypothetical protein